MASPNKTRGNKKVKNLLDFILLQSLDSEPMLEQQLVYHIHRTFGIRLNQATLNHVLNVLQNQGFIEGNPNIDPDDSPEKYRLTPEGRNMLTYAENTLIAACKQL
jgi:DNA-binding PadR family transcriptional regulator